MTIICHGDSLTEGADIEKAYAWPSLLENKLGIAVVNRGIGGDTTVGMLSRFSFDVVQKAPRFVILLGGTNDLWWDLALNLIQANLFSMVCQAQHYNIAPVLALPLPIWVEKARAQDWEPPAKGYAHFSGRLQELVKALTASAKECDVALLDFYHLFFDDQGKMRTDYFSDDGLHASRSGHFRMSQAAAALFRDVFNCKMV
jgi:lysophospholipase L1-like esterase